MKSLLIVLFTMLTASITSAAETPFQPAKVLTWPGMSAGTFGCMMEKDLRFRDKVFNCANVEKIKKRKWGDPCKNTKAYYAGPALPDEIAKKIHPSVSTVSLSWEHGALQDVFISFNKEMKTNEVKKIFGITLTKPYTPENIMRIDLGDKTNTSTLALTGFDHMGAGDVDCSE